MTRFVDADIQEAARIELLTLEAETRNEAGERYADGADWDYIQTCAEIKLPNGGVIIVSYRPRGGWSYSFAETTGDRLWGMFENRDVCLVALAASLAVEVGP